jgi:hypothetical protein
LERVAMQRGQTAAKQQGRDAEKGPDPNEDHAAFLEALARSHARYMEKFPPGYRPLDAALRAFAAAGPQPAGPRYHIREGVSLTAALEAFKKKCNGEGYDPAVYERIDGADDDLEEADVAGRA